MGVWQFTFIGFNMTHCLLAKTEHQQEIDSKNKDRAPSAFPFPTIHLALVLTQPPRRRAHKEPVRKKLPQSEKKNSRALYEQQDDLIDILTEKVLGANLAMRTSISGVDVRI